MTTNPGDLRADARRNYERLLAAASSIFRSQGPLVPFESIAKSAGVGVGTLYRHFPSRKVLLEAVYIHTLEELEAKAQALLATSTPAKALSTWLQLVTTYATESGGFGHLLMLEGEDRASPLMSAGSQLLIRAQAAGEMRKDVTIYDIFLLLQGTIAPGATPAELQKTQKLLAVVISGLRNSY